MKKLSKKQISAIKYLITRSPDGSKFIKQILWHLLDKSNGCTRNVAFTFKEGEEYQRDFVKSHSSTFSSMCSCNGTTHLHQIMDAAVANGFNFSLHYGSYTKDGFSSLGQFPGMKPPQTTKVHPKWAPMRFTIWLTDRSYGHESELTLVRVRREQLEDIQLDKPDLYPLIEKSTYPQGDNYPHALPMNVHGPLRRVCRNR